MAFSDGKHLLSPFDRNAPDGGPPVPSGNECSARIRQFGTGSKYVTARIEHTPLRPRARSMSQEGFPPYVGGELSLRLYFSQRAGPGAVPHDPATMAGWVQCARIRITAADVRAAAA